MSNNTTKIVARVGNAKGHRSSKKDMPVARGIRERSVKAPG